MVHLLSIKLITKANFDYRNFPSLDGPHRFFSRMLELLSPLSPVAKFPFIDTKVWKTGLKNWSGLIFRSKLGSVCNGLYRTKLNTTQWEKMKACSEQQNWVQQVTAAMKAARGGWKLHPPRASPRWFHRGIKLLLLLSSSGLDYWSTNPLDSTVSNE